MCLCLLVWTQWQRHWSFYCLKCQLTGKWIQIWNVINMKFCSFSLFNTDYMLLESMQFLDWPQRGKCACYKLYYVFNFQFMFLKVKTLHGINHWMARNSNRIHITMLYALAHVKFCVSGHDLFQYFHFVCFQKMSCIVSNRKANGTFHKTPNQTSGDSQMPLK